MRLGLDRLRVSPGGCGERVNREARSFTAWFWLGLLPLRLCDPSEQKTCRDRDNSADHVQPDQKDRVRYEGEHQNEYCPTLWGIA